jgi:hypothetical protein
MSSRKEDTMPKLYWFWPERGRKQTLLDDEGMWVRYRWAAEQVGLDLDIISVDDVDVLAAPHGPLVYVRGTAVDPAAAVFHNKLYTWPKFQPDVWRSLATFSAVSAAGYCTLLPPQANLISNDKAATLLHLRGVDRGWLPTVSLQTRDLTRLRVRLEEAGITYPVVVKPASWGSGQGLIRAAGEPELMMALRLAGAAELSMVVQSLVGEGGRVSDTRVYCVDRRPYLALRRTPAEGRIVSNVAAGGTGELIDVPVELYDRAAAIAAVMDTPWLGVDFLCAGEDRYLSEVEIDACIAPSICGLPQMDEVLLARFRAYLTDFDRWRLANQSWSEVPTATTVEGARGSVVRSAS